MGRVRELKGSQIRQRIFPDRVQKPTRTRRTRKRLVARTLAQGPEISPLKISNQPSRRDDGSVDYSTDAYAQLSRLVYNPDNKERRKFARRYGFDLVDDDEFAKPQYALFKSRNTGAYVLAFRGTVLTDLSDLAADLDIAKGKRENERWKATLDLVDSLLKKYPHLELTGHSLGGALALYAYQKYGLPTRVYNPGSSPSGEKFTPHANGASAEIVRHKYDAVSAGYVKYATETYGTEYDIFEAIFSDGLLHGFVNGQINTAHPVPS